MSEIKIERGIPIPKTKKKRFPFHEMKPGDSFWIEGDGHSVTSAYGYYRRTHNRNARFCVRKEGNGVRVWRLEDDT